MKSITWVKDTYMKTLGRESEFDILSAIVCYENGSEGRIHVNRAEMRVIKFEQEHLNKVMTEKDFEDYKFLIRQSLEVERSYEEDDE